MHLSLFFIIWQYVPAPLLKQYFVLITLYLGLQNSTVDALQYRRFPTK